MKSTANTATRKYLYWKVKTDVKQKDANKWGKKRKNYISKCEIC